MEYVLGIDQGASKTHAVVADRCGHILGMGKSYGACHSSSGLDYAVKAVIEASDTALRQSGLAREDIQMLVGGLTGIDWDDESEILENAVKGYFPAADIQIVNDCIIAMKGGTQSDCCAILCAGSGLNCAVQNGKDCFVYGFYIPDEYQGGAALGKKTVQAVFDAHMGIVPKTILTEMLLDYFKEPSVDKLLYRRVKGKIKDTDYLQLPILLEKAAMEGDKTAADIWKAYGKDIVVYLTARMKMMGSLNKASDIILSGSIFKCKFEVFKNTVKEEIWKSAPNANVIEAKYEPVIGAVLMALQEVNGGVGLMVYENLERSAEKFPILRMK